MSTLWIQPRFGNACGFLQLVPVNALVEVESVVTGAAVFRDEGLDPAGGNIRGEQFHAADILRGLVGVEPARLEGEFGKFHERPVTTAII